MQALLQRDEVDPASALLLAPRGAPPRRDWWTGRNATTSVDLRLAGPRVLVVGQQTQTADPGVTRCLAARLQVGLQVGEDVQGSVAIRAVQHDLALAA